MRYERIRYRDINGRGHTVYLRDPQDITFCDEPVVVGTQVDREGSQMGTLTISERRHLICSSLITKRTPMRMNNFYAELEEVGQ